MATNFKSKINLLDEVTYNNQKALNIFSKYDLVDVYKSNVRFYFEYDISPVDRWDTLANQFYGSPDLWWVIAIFNEINDPFEFLQSGNTINIIKSEFVPDLLLALRRVKNA